MPNYIYGCGKGHRQEENHGMNVCPVIYCHICGQEMHKVPQVFMVNWGGLPPHLEGTRSQVVKTMIDTASSRRNKYLETKGDKNGKEK